MGLNQMTMAILAFILLGQVSVTLRRAALDSQMTMTENRTDQAAVMIARSLLDEINRKKFDQANVDMRVVRLENLTASGSLGPGWSENYPNFNDVDDYNNALFKSPDRGTTGVTGTLGVLENTEGYVVRVRVQYVNIDNPTQVITTRSWCKLVTVTITNTYSKDVVRSTLVKTY